MYSSEVAVIASSHKKLKKKKKSLDFKRGRKNRSVKGKHFSEKKHLIYSTKKVGAVTLFRDAQSKYIS